MDEKLSVIEEQMPVGASEILHYHSRAQQFFFVLSGEAVMEVDGCETRLVAREGLHIPPGVRHLIRNVSSAPLRFLVISQPPSHGDRVVPASLQSLDGCPLESA
jgi:mannose-6-phosphate isomerase-like protein (cupin superfamily)